MQDLAPPTQTQVHLRMKQFAPALPKEAVLVNRTKKIVTVKFGSEPLATKASMALDGWDEYWHHPKARPGLLPCYNAASMCSSGDAMHGFEEVPLPRCGSENTTVVCAAEDGVPPAAGGQAEARAPAR